MVVADDNRDAADSLAMVLKFCGYDVRVAYTGREALELGARERPEAFILDIGMPDLTGYEAAQVIRSEAWGRHALLVAVTGWGQEEDRRRARAAGFDEHLTKPVDLERVRQLLADYLREKHALVTAVASAREERARKS